jgi:adenosylcobinamide-phosphate synthase
VNTALILVIALILDRLIGDPPWLWKHVTHPIVIIGRCIGWADARFNTDTWSARVRRDRGKVLVALGVVALGLIGYGLAIFLHSLWLIGFVVEVVIVAIFLAHKSLTDHVRDVSDSLRGSGGLEAGREAVSRIVGRDTSKLHSSGICRAALESLAENFSDGVVAPAFWYLIAGLPGLMIYKFVNTADSMIGHKTERHLHFGRLAAQLDDVLNWPAARLSAALIALAAATDSGNKTASARTVVTTTLADAGSHRSPNAGWPEVALAAALRLRFGGKRYYPGEGWVSAPTLNADGDEVATASHIHRGIMLINRAGLLMMLAVLLMAL